VLVFKTATMARSVCGFRHVPFEEKFSAPVAGPSAVFIGNNEGIWGGEVEMLCMIGQ
jgi:hypothetical protein